MTHRRGRQVAKRHILGARRKKRGGVMIELRASLLLFCTLLSLSARAQTVTDLELRAAYCLGVTKVQIERLQRLADEAKDKTVKDLNMQSKSGAMERNKRFYDYLQVKLPSLDDMDAALPALKVAIAHGRQDQQTCVVQGDEPFYRVCIDQCRPDILEKPAELIACVNKCPSPPSCRRVKKCLEDFLPF